MLRKAAPAKPARHMARALALRVALSVALFLSAGPGWAGSTRPVCRWAVDRPLRRAERRRAGGLVRRRPGAVPTASTRPRTGRARPRRRSASTSRALEAEVALGGEVALHQAQRDEQQHQHAHQDVETVEAGQHEEGGAEGS